jgi:hypothetical protein
MPFPGGPDLASQWLTIMHAMDNEPNLLVLLDDAGIAQFNGACFVKMPPAHQVRSKPIGDLGRWSALSGAHLG